MKKITLFLLAFLLVAPSAYAETVLRVGSNISVDADQIVNGDYYVSVGPFGNTSMSGTVEGDMYAFGATVTTNGVIKNDLSILSWASQLHATVTDDVRIVSGEVTVGEHIGGDLFVIGGTLKVLSTASIDGNIFFFGGNADINGKVGGSIYGSSDKIRIDAEVLGDIDVTAVSSITLGDQASISGNVNYKSTHDLVRAPNAQVEGGVMRASFAEADSSTTLKDALVPLFVTLFATLSLYLLFKREIELLTQRVVAHPVKSLLIGFTTLILGPLVSALLMVTVLGALVGVMGAAFTVLVVVVGYSVAGIILGAYLSKIITKKVDVSLHWVVVGTCVLYALLYVPLIGYPAMLCFLALGVGGVAYSAYKLLS